MITRRQFAKDLGIGLAAVTVGGSTGILTACDQTLYQKIMAYANVGAQSFQSVLNILIGANVIPTAPGGVIGSIVSMVKAGFTDLQVAVNDYMNAAADQKSSLAAKISLVLSVISNHITDFWTQLSIPDAQLSVLIQGLLGVVISTIAGFMTQLPPLQSSSKFTHSLVVFKVSPEVRTPEQFKKDFNSLLVGTNYTQYSLK